MTFPQKCPYCGKDITENPKQVTPSVKIKNFYYRTELHACFHCEQPIFVCRECFFEDFHINSKIVQYFPHLSANASKQLPDYIPLAIRKDYEEAYAVVDLSPNASAVLSRRCLQGMIRDFWEIDNWRFEKAIKELEDKISPETLSVLNTIRDFGNKGAHPDQNVNTVVDVTSFGARQLLKVIEILLNEWYIFPRQKQDALDDLVLIQRLIDIGKERQTNIS